MSGSLPQRPSYDELAALVGEQVAVIAASKSEVAALKSEVAALKSEVAALKSEIVALKSEIVALKSEVVALRRWLGMDSSNSSKPPSSDGLDRTKRSSSSGSSGKRGKPRGAPGATKMLVDDPDETVACRPAACGNCARDLGGAAVFASQRRQVFEVPPPPKPHVTEYQVESLTCPGCGAVTCGEAPAGVTGRVQYGPLCRVRHKRASDPLTSGYVRIGGVVVAPGRC